MLVLTPEKSAALQTLDYLKAAASQKESGWLFGLEVLYNFVMEDMAKDYYMNNAKKARESLNNLDQDSIEEKAVFWHLDETVRYYEELMTG